MIKKVVAVAAATGGLVLASAGLAAAHSGAQGAAVHSPGVLSGNVVQAPIHIPVNACGNTVNVIGLLNPAFGNTCINK
ncbi:chaplin [Streptomyces sp. NPDC052701]|uniref:chaplin n=1 Tax=Streptomyces sp. NPDC052701 TaxID=3155533 RepID=UPI00341B8364